MNRARRMRRIAMHKLACIFRERKRQTFISACPGSEVNRLAYERGRAWRARRTPASNSNRATRDRILIKRLSSSPSEKFGLTLTEPIQRNSRHLTGGFHGISGPT